ncbi:hypothetical protein GCM10010433_68180 [Streptomyces pulveraceus]|uniref:Uncharacterized protein n=1 Tax=Streptomyces pulveraceus TaxID=68258 RepID=A0ABW1GMM6_9ACTN
MIPAAFDHARTDTAHRGRDAARTAVAAVPGRGGTRPGGMPRPSPDRREPCRRGRAAAVAVLPDRRERMDPADRTHRPAHRLIRAHSRRARPGHPPLAARTTAAPPHTDARLQGRGPTAQKQPAAVVRGTASDA